MEIASSPTSPSRTSRSAIRTESPTHPESNNRVRFLTFPWGKVPPQRRKRGGTGLVLRTAPHPSGLRPATLSQERVFPLIRHALRRATFPVGEGFLRRGRSLTFPVGEGFLRRVRFLTFPAGEGFLRRGRFLTFPLAFQTFFPFTPFTNPLLCCKIGSSSQKMWEVWS